MNRLHFILFFLLAMGCAREREDYRVFTANPELYTRTVYQLNSVVMHDNFTPPVANRNYTYANIAAYECIAAGYPDRFVSLAGQLKELTKLPEPKNPGEIDFEFAAVLAFCKVGVELTFSEDRLRNYVDSIKMKAGKAGMPSSVIETTEQFATEISDVILDWSNQDNYLQTRSAPKYTVTNEPGKWIPTPPMYADAVEPAWNQIRALVLDSANQFPAPRPFPFDVENKSSPFYNEAIKIKSIVENLTDDQKHMADFWDDNPFKMNVKGHVMFATKKFSPPGHWMGVIGLGAKATGADFPATVCAYAKTSIAIFDAFIQCWDEKYRSTFARPETIINTYIDPDWTPYLQAPPFPEYTCGHTTTSAAAAEALSDVFGDAVSYTDTTELEFGIKSRAFKSFRHAAEENVWGRFYGGIHYHHSCVISNELGRKVGEYVVQKLRMDKKEQPITDPTLSNLFK
jgi:hypothetical protein